MTKFVNKKYRHLYKQLPFVNNPLDTCLSFLCVKLIGCGDYFDVILGPLDAASTLYQVFDLSL
jgi:hypothetical protein